MDNRMYMEERIKAPGAQPSPGMSATSKRPGAEPTLSGVSQVAFPDAAGMDSGKQPSSAPGGPEKGPRPRESSEEGPLELRTQEQTHPAGPRKKQSTPAPQEGPRELQAGRDQAKPGNELGVLPSRVPAAHEGKENEDQQGRQKHPGTVKGQAPQSQTAKVFSKVLVPFSIPTGGTRIPFAPHSPQNLVGPVLNFKPPNRCLVDSHCGLNLHFPDD
uniref:Uncharacterized protein n=1 Tax=Ursus americanus TaxID=9643 RepID=A0A452SEG1_URSAM